MTCSSAACSQPSSRSQAARAPKVLADARATARACAKIAKAKSNKQSQSREHNLGGGGGVGHGMQGWARKAKEQQKAFSATPRRDQARSSEHDAANRHRRRATVYKGAPASQRTWASGCTRDAPGAKSLCLLRRCLSNRHPNTSTSALPPTCADAQASMASSGRDPLRERDNVHHELIPSSSQRGKKLGKLGQLEQTEDEEE